MVRLPTRANLHRSDRTADEMLLAATADLHWGLSRRGDRATRSLAGHLEALQPDLFAIGGDIGEGEYFADCLAEFRSLRCPRLLVPGNHDLWTRGPRRAPAPRSLALYERELPRQAAAAGFHYLDQAPFLAAEARLALVGSINWYDYSYADAALEAEFPGVEFMYHRKLFPAGAHNDGRYVRLGMSDAEFTERVVGRLRDQLAALPPEIEQVVVLCHHPPVRPLFYPTPLETVTQRFWLAYTGNRGMEEVVMGDPRITTILCGHTHAACAATVDGRRCVNVGGDYDWKRLFLIDTATGREEAVEFRADDA